MADVLGGCLKPSALTPEVRPVGTCCNTVRAQQGLYSGMSEVHVALAVQKSGTGPTGLIPRLASDPWKKPEANLPKSTPEACARVPAYGCESGD